jgi:phosphatidylethanolamine-binding protein (PEBP) family uncharacterized protein
MTTCRRPGVVGVPEETVELAVLCEDPDAPRGTFTHWVLAGLEPTATGLAEEEHPAAAVEGRNDFGEEGYSGTLVGTYQR